MIDQRQQRGWGQHVEIAGPGRLAAAGRGADQAALASHGVDRGRQHAGNRSQRAVERRFAESDVAGDLVAGQHAHHRQQAEGDRQIEMTAFLENVGGSEIDGDPFRWQPEPEGMQRGAHPLATLGDRLVGQTDDGKGDDAAGHLHLNIDVEHLDALKRHCLDPRNHRRPASPPPH